MPDVFSKEKRKEVMASIRSKNSKAEMAVFSYLRKEGVYFQKHYKRAVGKPDIALPRKKKAVFIDGDFWHGRRLDEWISKNGENNYWADKIKNNVARDKKQRDELRANGWQLLVIWESDILRKRTQTEALQAIRNFLAPPTDYVG